MQENGNADVPEIELIIKVRIRRQHNFGCVLYFFPKSNEIISFFCCVCVVLYGVLVYYYLFFSFEINIFKKYKKMYINYSVMIV